MFSPLKMKLVISNETENGASGERTFEKSSVAIGRDAIECDISFDRDRFPMVSRRHAELRWQNGRWYVIDLGSSYGTFVNGAQISTATEVSAGGLIAIGTSGPVLRIVSV